MPVLSILLTIYTLREVIILAYTLTITAMR
jgi:hypothetical protein